ncbi:hypothetical protein [Streptomyces sp. ERV7]|uniref:hypothetical protein n=1 Tax=Streptomyces sp. ERV7 TaxID=1322334 RepID=UPI00131C7032|nr:hypothetical protein [Streptomyces sp. ERV7]
MAPALEHGPVWAFLAVFAVSPGAPALLALVLERRLLRPRHEFTAFLYGDPALAVSCAAGVWLTDSQRAASVPVTGWPAVAMTVPPLVFGLWQGRWEVRTGLYTRAQLLSPTKIWHQAVVYPLLTYLVGSSFLRGVTSGAEGPLRWVVLAVMAGCLLFWIAANVHDRRHPSTGHPPYEWRQLRPLASMDAMVRASAHETLPDAARNSPGPGVNQRP